MVMRIECGFIRIESVRLYASNAVFIRGVIAISTWYCVSTRLGHGMAVHRRDRL
jgi:hypothetical protein